MGLLPSVATADRTFAMHTPPPFLFAIDCTLREWNTPADVKAPSEPTVIHEARCIPGSLIGCGATRDEAVASLTRIIEWTLADELSPIDWYKRAWEKSGYEDHALFGIRAVRSARDVASVPPRKVRGVSYAALETVSC